MESDYTKGLMNAEHPIAQCEILFHYSKGCSFILFSKVSVINLLSSSLTQALPALVLCKAYGEKVKVALSSGNTIRTFLILLPVMLLMFVPI